MNVFIEKSRADPFFNYRSCIRGCLHEKTRTGASFMPGWLFFMSYRVYIMTGSFHISLFEGTLHVDKVHVRFKIADITGRPISHRNGWSFRVYMIPLQDFVPGWNSRPGKRTGVNSRRGDSCRHDILWYHVNKYRAMRGNRSELVPGRKSPWCHVNTPLLVQVWVLRDMWNNSLRKQTKFWEPTSGFLAK